MRCLYWHRVGVTVGAGGIDLTRAAAAACGQVSAHSESEWQDGEDAESDEGEEEG